MTASLIRAVGLRLRRYALPLVGYWDLLALLQKLHARIDVLEAAVGHLQGRSETGANVSQRTLDYLGRIEAGLAARLDAIAAHQSLLTGRDGALVETVAAEIDRLDGYLLHHVTMLSRNAAAAHVSLLRRSTTLEQGIAVAREEVAEAYGSLLRRSAALEQEIVTARIDAGPLQEQLRALTRVPDRAYVRDGMDALVMAGTFDLLVPTQELGLLAYLLRHGPDAVEPGVRAVLQNRLKPGAVAVDIGANLGLHALTMAAAVGPNGRVLCFEPLPHLAAALARTLRLNDFAGRARVEEAALADLPGEAMLHRAAHSPLSSLYSLPEAAGAAPLRVRVSTLDEAVSPGSRVDFVKMDVEGAEPLVWRGMRRVLAENEAIEVVLEWSVSHFGRSGEDPEAFMAAIRGAGFGVYEIDNTNPAGRLAPLGGAATALEACNLLLTRSPVALNSAGAAA